MRLFHETYFITWEKSTLQEKYLICTKIGVCISSRIQSSEGLLINYLNLRRVMLYRMFILLCGISRLLTVTKYSLSCLEDLYLKIVLAVFKGLFFF